MLTVQHLSRLGPQGAIVSKGTGPPPLVTGRRVKPIIGEAWEIQYRVGRGGEGTPSLGKSTFSLSKSMSRLLSIAWWCVTPFCLFYFTSLCFVCFKWPSLPSLPSSSCHVSRPPGIGSVFVYTSFTILLRFYLSPSLLSFLDLIQID